MRNLVHIVVIVVVSVISQGCATLRPCTNTATPPSYGTTTPATMRVLLVSEPDGAKRLTCYKADGAEEWTCTVQSVMPNGSAPIQRTITDELADNMALSNTYISELGVLHKSIHVCEKQRIEALEKGLAVNCGAQKALLYKKVKEIEAFTCIEGNTSCRTLTDTTKRFWNLSFPEME